MDRRVAAADCADVRAQFGVFEQLHRHQQDRYGLSVEGDGHCGGVLDARAPGQVHRQEDIAHRGGPHHQLIDYVAIFYFQCP